MSFILNVYNGVKNSLNTMTNTFNNEWEKRDNWMVHPLKEPIFVKQLPVSKEAPECDPFDDIMTIQTMKKVEHVYPSKVSFHGTSLSKINEQIKKGEFENRNSRIYFGSLPTAYRYASMYKDGVIVEIGSDEEYKMNSYEEMMNDNKGTHCYFPPEAQQKAPVQILKVYPIKTPKNEHELMFPSPEANMSDLSKVVQCSKSAIQAVVNKKD